MRMNNQFVLIIQQIVAAVQNAVRAAF